MEGTVVKEWLNNLSWKEQTVLFCAIRGTDISGSKDLKLMTRWMRSVILNNAAPNKTFMKETEFRDIDEITEENPLVFDMLPVHFFGHLLHAFEVIGYRHPDREISKLAYESYVKLCKYIHLYPETVDEMSSRLEDEVKK